MSNDWSVYIFILVIAAIVLARLDRIGKQLEAVSVSIRTDLARTEDKRDEIISEWKRSKSEAAREARQFWIFWGVVGLAALIWAALKNN